jgi:hypothetical protein
MEIALSIMLTIVSCALVFAAWQWNLWRKSAQSAQEFINNPNVKAVDKQAEYKDTFEAQINALDEERRQINVAMTEVFDVLNDETDKRDDPRLMQCRNILLRALNISTHGRG